MCHGDVLHGAPGITLTVPGMADRKSRMRMLHEQRQRNPHSDRMTAAEVGMEATMASVRCHSAIQPFAFCALQCVHFRKTEMFRNTETETHGT